MLGRTIGLDLAIRGEPVAQVFEDGRPLGKPIRFRLSARSLRRFVDTISLFLIPAVDQLGYSGQRDPVLADPTDPLLLSPLGG